MIIPIRHIEEDINVAIDATEKLLAWTHGKDGHISQTVNSLRFVDG